MTSAASNTPSETRLVAVDWGTSSLRGALLDGNGRVLEEKSLARGILTVAPGEFASVFEANFADWMRADATICLISGMAGSKQGWVEATYCPCPAGFDELAAHLTWVEPGRIAIVPGLCCDHPSDVSGLPSVPDVMRGEEVQIFGAMQLTGLRDGLFVLPGTHSKWAHVSSGRVTGFQTYMTGEFYALLSQQSLLAKTIDASAAFDETAFLQGVAQARQGAGLLHNAFSARTLSLFSRMSAAALASYLSGLVIGEELLSHTRSQTLMAGTEVVLMGSSTLTQRYTLALAQLGITPRALGSEATWSGLSAIAKALPA